QITPGAGTQGTCRQGAPGVADAVPVFALSSKYRSVSCDRSAGARGAPLRPRGIPTAEAEETRGVPGAARLTTGAGRAPPGHDPLPPAAGRLSPPDPGARAAEAADAARPPDHPAAHRRAATGALCHGRPALCRSDHAGLPQPPGRSRPHRPHLGAVDLPTRLQPALDGTLVPHAGDTQSLATTPGGADGRPDGS